MRLRVRVLVHVQVSMRVCRCPRVCVRARACVYCGRVLHARVLMRALES